MQFCFRFWLVLVGSFGLDVREWAVTRSQSSRISKPRRLREIYLESLETKELTYGVKIDTHYAITNVITSHRNNGSNAVDTELSVILPDGAFISGFQMTVNGVEFEGVVLPKQQAEEVFERAVQAGQSAGLVTDASDNVFDFTANVASNSVVIFSLTYEQVLTRRFGWYEYAIDLQHPQARVNIFVSEENGISEAEVPSPVNPAHFIEQRTDKTLTVDFPASESDFHVPHGDTVLLTLRYKINPSPHPVGTFVADQSREFFVHLFSPPPLNSFKKAVVFVLDRSGSMSGAKFEQLRQAAHIIVEQSFTEDDVFNFVYFNSYMSTWRNKIAPASEENKADAHLFIDDMSATGGTNIDEAIVTAINMLKNANLGNTFANQVIFLTDGHPTAGVISTQDILLDIDNANVAGFSIHTLGLGDDVNYQLLRAISLENNGFSRRIEESEGVESALVLFVEEIEAAVLSDIEISYSSSTGEVKDVTKATFHLLFEDSEAVIAGRIPGDTEVMEIEANGILSDRTKVHYEQSYSVALSLEASAVRGSVVEAEKIWAFLTINELQDKIDVLSGTQKDRSESEAQILEMSLAYGFVTSYTSLVVVPQLCVMEPDVRKCAQEHNSTYNGSPPDEPPAPAEPPTPAGYPSPENEPPSPATHQEEYSPYATPAHEPSSSGYSAAPPAPSQANSPPPPAPSQANSPASEPASPEYAAQRSPEPAAPQSPLHYSVPATNSEDDISAPTEDHSNVPVPAPVPAPIPAPAPVFVVPVIVPTPKAVSVESQYDDPSEVPVQVPVAVPVPIIVPTPQATPAGSQYEGCAFFLGGRTGYNEEINALYTHIGYHEGRPYYRGQSNGMYIYWIYDILLWAIGDTLGLTNVYAFVEDDAETGDQINAHWNVWNGNVWEVDKKVTIAACVAPVTPAPTPIHYFSPNERCDLALPVLVEVDRDSILGDTTATVSYEPEIEPVCHSDLTDEGVPVRDLWYSVVGTGQRLFASTCSNITNFDTVVSIWNENCLECVGSQDDGLCQHQSRIEWDAATNAVYMIQVHGYYQDVGVFELTVGVADAELSPNERCDQALSITIATTPTLLIGNTRATIPTEPEVKYVCHQENSVRDLWYSVVGTGDTFFASTCGDVTEFDTIVSLWDAECLECLQFNDDDKCGEHRSYMQWDTVAGVLYKIQVHGYYKEVGIFELTAGVVDTVTLLEELTS